jgi:AmpD protein
MTEPPRIENGWLTHARHVPSPHCDERPDPGDISLIVIHGISLPPGEFGGPWIEKLFTGTLPAEAHPYFAEIQGLKVSSHLLVRRDGELVQFVPFHLRAWHAGVSCFQGRERCNDYSIGIELEGTDTLSYAEAQYQRMAEVIPLLCAAYPAITEDRIVGHCHIAPGRKADPGPAFDWSRLKP